LVIGAATACRFLDEGAEFAEERLNGILEGTEFEGTPEQHLDLIYLTVLRSSVPKSFRAPEKVRLHARHRRVLGSIALLSSPLSAVSLAKVISISETQVMQTLQRLQAILEVPKDVTGFLRLHHPSFRDFLLNKDRCGDFWVDEKETHQLLATNCMQLLSNALKQDILDINQPGALVAEVESSCLEQCLPSEVQYACRYWIHHYQKCGVPFYDNDRVHRFLQEHLLHWLEALAWMKKLTEAFHAIVSLKSTAVGQGQAI
jgi:hypothetical protein